jgi:hypothetical protein
MKDKLNRNRPLRLDDMSCEEWSALTPGELQKFAPLKLSAGKSEVDRLLLARLLGERDRLYCVLESADWLIEELTNAGFIDLSQPTDTKNLDPLERAIYCLRLAIASAR